MKLDPGDQVRIELTGIQNATLVSVYHRVNERADIYSVADGDDIGARVNAILAMRTLKKQNETQYPGPMPEPPRRLKKPTIRADIESDLD